jgi:hypothetical protein
LIATNLLWFVRSLSHSHYLYIDGENYIGMIIRSDVIWSSLSLLPFYSIKDHPFGFVTFKKTISCKAHETALTNHECLSLWFLTCLWFDSWSFDKISFDDPPTCDLTSSSLLLSGMDQIVIGATCVNILIPIAPFNVVFNSICNGCQGFC